MHQSTASDDKYGNVSPTVRRLIFLVLVCGIFGIWLKHRLQSHQMSEALTFRDRLIRLRYATTFWIKLILPLQNGRLQNKRILIDTAGETVVLSNAQGQTLYATLYRPEDTTNPIHPGILLLHGSTPAGRKLAMYRLIGRKLAEHGFAVLSLDQRGYGDSDDPRRLDRTEDFDFPQDARIALRYLANLHEVDAKQIYLIGHSFGGDVAIAASTDDPIAQKIVVIGPGRRYAQRAEKELDHFRLRASEYMGISGKIPLDVFAQTFAAFPLEHHLDHFRTSQHKPLLLIDGSHENADDVRFLQQMFTAISESKQYYTLPEADHYVNITGLGPFVVYDQHAVTQLIKVITQWLDANLHHSHNMNANSSNPT